MGLPHLMPWVACLSRIHVQYNIAVLCVFILCLSEELQFEVTLFAFVLAMVITAPHCGQDNDK